MATSDFESFVRECLGGVRENQVKLAIGVSAVRDSHEKLATEVLRIVPDVEALKRNETRQDRLLITHDHAIDKHQRRLDTHQERLDKHEGRIGELEVLPSARAPYDSMSDLGDEDDEGDRTSPGGNFVDPIRQQHSLEKRVAAGERTINRLRQEREAERERAKIIEEERARVAAEAKRKEELSDKMLADDRKKSDRRLKRTVVLVGLLATLLSIAAHFLRLLPSAEKPPQETAQPRVK